MPWPSAQINGARICPHAKIQRVRKCSHIQNNWAEGLNLPPLKTKAHKCPYAQEIRGMKTTTK